MSLFENLLSLYPAEYRLTFGGEILGVHQTSEEAVRKQGVLALSSFRLREFLAAMGGAFREHLARRREGLAYLVPEPVIEVATMSDRITVEQQLNRALKRMQIAIATHNFPAARQYALHEEAMRRKLRELS